MSTKKILITGATGAIGREILKQLNASNALDGVTVFARDLKHNRKFLKPYADKIYIIHGDIRNKEDVLRACKEQDIVIHLAAILPTNPVQTPELTQATIVNGTDHIVSCLEEIVPNVFLIFSSSIVVYGDRLKNPLIRVTDKLVQSQNDAYAEAKILAESRIRNSKLKWSIFRLTVIMGVGNHKISGKMFEVPLDTPLEIATVRDTARAFIHATEQLPQLESKIFNLGGGQNCRITYHEFLTRAFQIFGLGKVNFPEFSFAKQNFHCGYYADGDALEEILSFQQDDIESYFERFKKSIPGIQRFITIPFAEIIKWFLLRLSKPYKAYKLRDKELMNYFFGNIDK